MTEPAASPKRRALVLGGAALAVAAVAAVLVVALGGGPLLQVTSVRALDGGEALVHALAVTDSGKEDATRESTLALVERAGVRWSVAIRPGALVGELAEPHLVGDAERVYALWSRRSEERPDPSATPLELDAWDRKNGAPLWQLALRDGDNDFPTPRRLALAAGVVLVMDRGLGVTALDPATGATRWHVDGAALGPVESWFVGRATLGAAGRDGMRVVSLADGRLVAAAPLASEGCQLGDAVLGPSVRDGEVVLASLDPTVAPRVVAGAGLADAIWCATSEGRIVALDERVAVAVDVARAELAWRRDLVSPGGLAADLGKVQPSELVGTVLRGVPSLGAGPVLELALEGRGRARWASLDLASGELTPRGDGALGFAALGSAALVGERLPPRSTERPRVVLFDGRGQALAAWTAERRTGLLLRPWAVADDALWVFDPRPVRGLDALAWTVVSLKDGAALARHGEPVLAPLPSGTTSPLR